MEFEEISTVSESKEAGKRMNQLKEEGKLKESALIGYAILKGYLHTALVERQMVKVAFGELNPKKFYEHVIQQANKTLKEFQ